MSDRQKYWFLRDWFDDADLAPWMREVKHFPEYDYYNNSYVYSDDISPDDYECVLHKFNLLVNHYRENHSGRASCCEVCGPEWACDSRDYPS